MSTAVPVEVDELSVAVESVSIVTGLTLHAPAGTLVGLVGPNGSGKSTLLRAIARVWRPATGTVLVGGDDVWRLPARRAAQRTAVLAQETPLGFDLDVEGVVALGRTPHHGWLGRDSGRDRLIVRDALARVGMSTVAERSFASLSGGEKQRVLLARALAQEPQVLLLDEPTNHLDIAAQLELLDLVGRLGITVIAALHDLNLATGWSDQIVVLHSGRVVAAGAPGAVLDEQVVERVYGVRVHRSDHPLTGRPYLAFAPRDASIPTIRTDKESRP
ncbi:MAG: ABC transporter ATP-binding protein [Ilumatobacteraceae bacterium]